jgi:hypothetical protein
MLQHDAYTSVSWKRNMKSVEQIPELNFNLYLVRAIY